VNLPKFFAELKRRNVYKVAVAYAVVAWLLMQIAVSAWLDQLKCDSHTTHVWSTAQIQEPLAAADKIAVAIMCL
jgi:hypothetical protein